MTEETRDQKILRLYGEGLLLKNIATQVGLSSHYIGVILRKHGIERPPKPQRRPGGGADPTPKVIELWGQGLCATQIAERLSITRRVVDLILRVAKVRAGKSPRHRYDSATPGGSGRSGFVGNMVRRV